MLLNRNNVVFQHDKSTAKQKILWWEKKRLLFNVYNLIFLALGIIFVSLINSPLVNFFLAPFFVLWFLFINLYYTVYEVIIVWRHHLHIEYNAQQELPMNLTAYTVKSCSITLGIVIGYVVANIP